MTPRAITIPDDGVTSDGSGASPLATGLAGAEAPEPHSRLGPSDGIPSAERGTCRYGHPNTPENTQRIGKAGLRCKECRRRIARESARRARCGEDRERVLANARRANAAYRARKAASHD